MAHLCVADGIKLLDQGGFGAMCRAWDINLEKPCALKENLDTSPEAQAVGSPRLLSKSLIPNSRFPFPQKSQI